MDQLVPEPVPVGVTYIVDPMVPTVTAVEAGADVPPAPVQVTAYVVLVVGVTLNVPDVARVPVNVPPVAVHDVASVEDQVRSAD